MSKYAMFRFELIQYKPDEWKLETNPEDSRRVTIIDDS